LRPAAYDHERSPWLPVAAIAGTIVTWGLASPLIKLADIGGPALAFHRLWIGAVLLFAILALTRTPITRAGMRWALPAGLLFGVNMVLFVVSVKMTTVANATLIGALQPAITLLFAGRIFGEVVTRREVSLVALAIAGVAIVIVGSAGSPEWNPLGDLLAACAVLTFTVYFFITKRARETIGTLEYMTGVHIAAAVVVMPLVLFNPADLWQLGWADVGVVMFIAFISGTAGQVVIGWAHRYVDISLSSLMMLGVPAVAAFAAWIMLDETLGPLQVIGGAITLGAIGAMVRRKSPSAVVEPVPELIAPIELPPDAAVRSPRPASHAEAGG
jgi:drug/metabolite transporter (DMT)-like permease